MLVFVSKHTFVLFAENFVIFTSEGDIQIEVLTDMR